EALSQGEVSRRPSRTGTKPEPHGARPACAGGVQEGAGLLRAGPGHAAEALPQSEVSRRPPRSEGEPEQPGVLAEGHGRGCQGAWLLRAGPGPGPPAPDPRVAHRPRSTGHRPDSIAATDPRWLSQQRAPRSGE